MLAAAETRLFVQLSLPIGRFGCKFLQLYALVAAIVAVEGFAAVALLRRDKHSE